MTQEAAQASQSHVRSGTPLEVFSAFLKLGVTSFGGPIAHIGYFRTEIVLRRRWLDEREYANVVSLCQLLPGPASSQVGVSLGLMRAGYLGGLCAWLGFTLPSAAILVAFAYAAQMLSGGFGQGLAHGLQLVAVAIVAQAVWGMCRTLCPDGQRLAIALLAMCLMLFSASFASQVAVIVVGGLAGRWLCRNVSTEPSHHLRLQISRRVGVAALAIYLILLAGLPILGELVNSPGVALFGAFYRSGALVFGGGHVVLPLLRAAVVDPGWVAAGPFLSGYGAAQAVPGPLFTFAAYLGAITHVGPGGLIGATLCLLAIFLPGMLILLGTLPFWGALQQRTGRQAILQGVNAAVVGILAAALYDPIWSTAVKTHADFAVAVLGFMLLSVWHAPPVVVVALGAASGVLAHALAA